MDRHLIRAFLITGLALPAFTRIFPQNDLQNYLITQSPRVPLSDTSLLNAASPGQVSTRVEYVDGLGRPTQQIDRYASAAGHDVVSFQVYDLNGRQPVEYLPYVLTSPPKGEWQENPLTGVQEFYSAPPEEITPTTQPFREKVFDGSPLHEVTRQGAEGKVWDVHTGHPVCYDRYPSPEEIPRWVVSAGNPAVNGTYPACSLLVREITDENGNISREYSDKKQRVILRESLLEGRPLQTFYVYDAHDRLAAVIPPEAAAGNPAFDDLVFLYRYDNLGRMVEKKLPGMEPVYLIYDRLERPVLTQDGNMRKHHRWRYTKYDAPGRVAETGIYTDVQGRSREALQSIMDQYREQVYEQRDPHSGEYSRRIFPVDNLFPLVIHYYDRHDFPGAAELDNLQDPDFPEPAAASNKGRQTGSRVRVGKTGEWLLSVMVYDRRGRLIRLVSENHLGGLDRVFTAYDFTGQVIRSRHQHSVAGKEEVNLYTRNEYDHAGRLIRRWHRVNDQAEVLMVENRYNEIGQPVEKNLHATGEGKFLQSVDYRYNVRGWLTHINHPEQAEQEGDLFAQEIHYLDPPRELGAQPRYNGDITAARWVSAGDAFIRGYGYSYDELNRLTSAGYGKYHGAWSSAEEDYSVPFIGYDGNGNIDSLRRMGPVEPGVYGIMDDLRCHYRGNRLIALDDGAAPTLEGRDFDDRGWKWTQEDTLPEYRYDACGNMTGDVNRGIVKVTYNHLNLPEEIRFAGDNIIRHLYDATGRKLRKEVYEQSLLQPGWLDYCGAFVYRSDTLAWVLTGEGKLVPGEEGFEYEYFLKDHLGNIRVCVRDSGGVAVVVQREDYYPFGMVMGGRTFAGDDPVPYLYNGKEAVREFELGWLDYGARFYDPQVGRWWVVDAMGEERNGISPYNFVQNNPLNRIDPDGTLDDGYKDLKGNYKWFEDEKDEIIYRDNKIWLRETDDRNLFDMASAGLFNNSFGSNPGIIKEPDKLTKLEMWLESPSENIGEGIIKIGANIGYSILNSPYSLFTGQTVGGTPLNSSEKMDAFVDFVPGLLSGGLTKTGQVVKTTGKGLQGFNQFVKRTPGITAAEDLPAGMKWQQRAGQLFQTNIVNQLALKDYGVGLKATGVTSITKNEIKKKKCEYGY